jgi:hypothetical protein
MTPFVLDDGPFAVVAKHADGAWAWPAATLHVVREVAAPPLDRSRERHEIRQRALALTCADGPFFAVHDLLVGGSAAEYLYGHLRLQEGHSTLNLGEDASIALCAFEMPAGVFVSMDKHAMMVALGELGRGRVASAFDVWDELRASGLISAEEFRILCDRTLAKDRSLPGLPRRFVP